MKLVSTGLLTGKLPEPRLRLGSIHGKKFLALFLGIGLCILCTGYTILRLHIFT